MNQVLPTPTSVPSLNLSEADRVTLDTRLDELLRIMHTRPKHYQAPPGLSDEQVATNRAAFDLETQSLIREQITILTKLRRTSAGPAKKGGKRAKAAPIDLGALMKELVKL